MASRKIFSAIVLVLIINGALGQKCKGGAECVLLESCSGLFNNLKQSYKRNLLKLAGSLLCGFEELDKPKVCCPSVLKTQFQNPDPTEPQLSSRFGEFSDSVSLLPNLTVCGIQEIKKISDNVGSALEEHPWIALLRFDKPNGWGFYCGGVLISSRYVMTSANCVKGNNLPSTWNLTQVRLGEWNTSSSMDCDRGFCNIPPLDLTVEQIIVHEDYDPADRNQLNDIALLRLEQEVQFNDFIKPICLPMTKRYEGYDMEVAGWGETGSRGESEVKLIVHVSSVEMSLCSRLFNRLGRQITSKQMCANDANGVGHRPDSGSALMVKIPLFDNWMAVGVLSYGPTLIGFPGWPSVYTQVGAYVDWITSQLKL